MIVVVLGPDGATVRATVARLIERQDPSGLNTSRLDGRSATAAEIRAQVASVGFFGARRVVIVDDLLARATKAGQAAESAEPAALSLDLTAIIGDVATETTLILVEPSLTGLPAAVRKVLPADAEVHQGEPPRGAHLVAWLQGVAKDEETSLSQPAARLLAERLYPQTWTAKPANPRYDRPPDLDRLRNEIAKLALAAHPGPIERTHVEALTASGDEDRIFRFVEAASTGRLGPAIVELDRLVTAGEEPYRIAAQLGQQIELGIVMAHASQPPVAVGKALGLSNPNRMTGVAGGIRGLTPGTLAQAAVAATAADRKLKRGELRDPMAAIHEMMAEAARTVAQQVGRKQGG